MSDGGDLVVPAMIEGGPATMTLAELITRLAAGVPRLDEAFARNLARALHAQAAHVRIPDVDALGLGDVVVTLQMDRSLRLVVTGNLEGSGGEITAGWREADFVRLDVALHADPVDAPYTFATLDFSCRGRTGTLLTSADPLPAGQQVTVRVLATVGGVAEYRVKALGMERSVSPHAIALDDA